MARWSVKRMGVTGAAAAAVVAILWVWLRLGARGPHGSAAVPTEVVRRQNITVTIEATGAVEPIDLVEVKSKASGQILKMPVEVGSVVKAGDLLAQIDPVTVQNQYDQAYAALRAAQAKADISRTQKQRADDLYSQGVLTAPELESAALDFANSQSALVRARTDLDLARQARADATVRAPISGTVLAQPVAVGQVIASAISSVSGGTTLLQMADLSRIRMRALVAETDIGSVRAGQVASVTVDAFPQRPFTASVEKIEPQAVVQQSVTMFPVLISISNQQGLLLPGMNGEVSVLIAERDSVPAVSLDAVRTVRELPAVVSALGMNLDSVRAEVQRQVEAMAREREAAMDDAGRASGGANGNASGGASGASDRESMRGRFAQMRGRGPGGGAPDSARMRRWMARGGGGRGAGGGAGFGAAGGNGGGFAAAGGAAFAGTSAGGRAGRAQVVFVRTAAGLAPRVVRLGVSNYDYAQVLSGVKEGDEVALLSVAEIQAKRQQDQSRLRERMGSGMPGVSATPGGRGGTRGGGGR